MASTKEALCIVLDVGPSMNQAAPDDDTLLQTSKDAINMILQRKMFAESKDEIALVLYSTTATANDLDDGESYQHISVSRPLGLVDWEILKYIETGVTAGDEQSTADILDALVVAMDTIIKGIQGKKGFISKRIILFSDMAADFADDQLDDIVGSMKEQEIEFNVIGPNLDEDDDEENKDNNVTNGAANGAAGDVKNEKDTKKPRTAQQQDGDRLLRHIIAETNGESYTFAEAIPALSYFQSKSVRAMPWKCNLEISPELAIPINGYKKTTEAKPKSYKNVYAADPDAAIQRVRSFHRNDDEETELETNETVEGHRYGSSVIPFDENDKATLKFKVQKCFKVVGFTKAEFIKQHILMGDSCMAICPEKGDEAAAMALSAFIQALHEINMVAVVRRVYSAAASVKIGVLSPHIKARYQCLYYHELPFTEDLRMYDFKALPIDMDNDDKKALAGKPSQAQLDVMDELISAMDLSEAAQDADGEKTEAIKPKHTFNPHLQRLYQCLQHRALRPDDSLPELSPLVASYLETPAAVTANQAIVVDKMCKLFTLKDVSTKKATTTGEEMFKDNEDGAPPAKKVKVEDNVGLTGGMAALTKAKVTEIGTVTPVEDFRELIKSDFKSACEKMKKRIKETIVDSFKNNSFTRASNCIKAFREEAIKAKDAGIFNEFLQDMKVSVAYGRTDYWEILVAEKISLIASSECTNGGVSQGDVNGFIKKEETSKPAETAPEEDDDDLFDEM